MFNLFSFMCLVVYGNLVGMFGIVAFIDLCFLFYVLFLASAAVLAYFGIWLDDILDNVLNKMSEMMDKVLRSISKQYRTKKEAEEKRIADEEAARLAKELEFERYCEELNSYGPKWGYAEGEHY